MAEILHRLKQFFPKSRLESLIAECQDVCPHVFWNSMDNASTLYTNENWKGQLKNEMIIRIFPQAILHNAKMPVQL